MFKFLEDIEELENWKEKYEECLSCHSLFNKKKMVFVRTTKINLFQKNDMISEYYCRKDEPPYTDRVISFSGENFFYNGRTEVDEKGNPIIKSLTVDKENDENIKNNI